MNVRGFSGRIGLGDRGIWRPETVGIIGLGSVGRALAKLLSSAVGLVYHDIHPGRCREAAESYGGYCLGDLHSVVRAADYTIVATPPSQSRRLILEAVRIARSEGAGSRVISDTLTFKKWVADLYSRTGDHPVVIGIHPLFSSRISNPRKHMLVVASYSGVEDYVAAIKKLFTDAGLNVIEMTPDEHDIEVARTIGLSYLLGQLARHAIQRMGGSSMLASTTYRLVEVLSGSIASDSCSLVEEILSDEDVKRLVIPAVEEALKAIKEESSLACGEEGSGFYESLYCMVENCVGYDGRGS